MDYKKVLDEICEKTVENISVFKGLFPEFAKDGKYNLTDNLSCWTNGFFPGMIWIAYLVTKDGSLIEKAREYEKTLDKILSTPENLGHDVGFMWSLASVSDYKITGSDLARRRGQRAAKSLLSRFNPAGFIRSWGDIPGLDTRSWTIIDNMMNLPILYWGAEEFNEPGYENVALAHIQSVLKYQLRADGSVNHIIKLDPYTCEWIEDRNDCAALTQGKSIDSSWTRGQAWALYGLAVCAEYSKRADILDAAKRVAHYFIAALDDTCVPPSDFRHGTSAAGRDSSAGACAACGLLELANIVREDEKQMYQRWAEKIICGLYEHCYAEKNFQNVLLHGSTHYFATDTADVGLIYGDYFFTEALYRLTGGEIIFW